MQEQNLGQTKFEKAKELVLSGKETTFSLVGRGEITWEEAEQLNDLWQQRQTGKSSDQLATVRQEEAALRPDLSVNRVPQAGGNEPQKKGPSLLNRIINRNG